MTPEIDLDNTGAQRGRERSIVAVLARCAVSLVLLAGIVGGVWFLGRPSANSPGQLRELVVGGCYNLGEPGEQFEGPAIHPGEPAERLKIRKGECDALHSAEVVSLLPEVAYLDSTNHNVQACLTAVRGQLAGRVRTPMSTAVASFRFAGTDSHVVYCLLQFSPPHQGRVVPPAPAA